MKRAIHRAILWYMRRAGGRFHTGPYGDNGRYVALFTDAEWQEHSIAVSRMREAKRSGVHWAEMWSS